ncbi:riboflavin transporter 2-like [Gigantopelta aegis]|uniref:riboflavin transporter 2-like n=1 Tax=Gigantopelta aegis TaxID=1735272 RepID=UPI001B88DB7B|nr:riboflavin transporter 2-like [Gigantopelta aegis]
MPKSNNYVVHILVFFCGMSLWLDIEGIINEMPVMINYLPEGWKLASYVNICIAVAFPIALVIVLAVSTCKKENSKYFACSALMNQVLQLIVLSFIWRKTYTIEGEIHSIGLFAVIFVLGCSGRAYSIIFLSILETMKSEYVASYFIGEGIGLMVCPMLAFVQGAGHITCQLQLVGEENRLVISNESLVNRTEYKQQTVYEDPLFPVQVYILILAGTALVPLVSFILLNWNPLSLAGIIESKRQSSFRAYDQDERDSDEYLLLPRQDHVTLPDDDHQPTELSHKSNIYEARYSFITWLRKHSHNAPDWYVLALAAFVQMQICAFPFALGTYYSLPYGHKTFHLIITIGNTAIAMASITGRFFSVTSWPIIGGITALSSSLSAYIVVVASLSPNPPLAGRLAGTIITIGVWCIQNYSLAYLKLCLAKKVHNNKTSMTLFGVAMEIGFLLGNIIAFILIGILKLFNEKSFC